MRFRRSVHPKAQADLIPMIDVVFQLILFFLVSTTFVVLPGIAVNLPSSQTAESASVGGITITMSSDGAMWLNDELVDFASLDTKLANFDEVPYEQRLEYPIRLEADGLQQEH